MKRLEKIFAIIQKISTSCEIYDLCCDHGKLGIMALNNSQERIVHFNDISPLIINKLEIKLKSFEHHRYSLEAKDAKNLKIDPEKSSVVVIAGVGGECALEIVEGLITNNQALNSTFVVCSHYHNFELRSGLIALGMKLVSQDFFFDGKWPYELLVIDRSSHNEIPIFNPQVYDLSNLNHRKYLLKSLKHYTFKSNQFMVDSINLLLNIV